MEKQDWQRLRSLFHAALDRPAAQREAFLKAACDGEPELEAQLRRWLSASAPAATGPLDQPFFDLFADPREDAAAGALLGGRYALERRLGSGGMGVVYLARRADGEYSGEVAVKLLHPIGSRDLERRLLSERQILASLQHPHIARLLDGGTTLEGRPFLVMEYIVGEPVDRYCDRRSLNIEARLELFRKICAAVHFAHQNLVVHRDLKPGNVLVTTAGEPKLLDFGVAKLLPQDDAATGLTPMTLEYASPEQLRGESASTAVDVYALGILLYELLVGSRPFRRADGSVDELVRAVTEKDPLPPSLLVTRAGDQEPARRRATTVRGLRRRLEGDLDTIVLKALHKSPQRRYPSADELARDIERHLNGLPVMARPDTLAYRLGKLVGRHRWGTSAVIAVMIGLLVFSYALVLEQRETARQWRRAETVAAFLQDTLRLPDVEFAPADALFLRHAPAGARGAQVPLQEVLDQAARELPTLDDELLRADLAAILGQVYRRLGLHEPAAALLARALAERRRLRGDLHPDVAHSLILQADLDADRDRLAAAAVGYQQALEISRRNGDERQDLIFGIYSGLGRVALQRHDLTAALDIQRRALTLSEEEWGRDDRRYADTLLAIAEIERQRDEPEAAERFAHQALEAFERAYPRSTDHPRLAAALVSLGLLAERSGNLHHAAAHLDRALTMRRALYGDDHPAVADALHALAGVRRQLPAGLAGALESCVEALRIHRAVYGADSAPAASSLNLEGLLLADAGDLNAAEDRHRRALEIWRRTLGEDHPLIASAHTNLGRVLHRQLRFAAARDAYREALRIYRDTLGDDHFQVGRVLNNLGSLELDRRFVGAGSAAEAETVLRRADAVLRGRGNPLDLAVLRVNLALAVERQRRPAEAADLYRQALEVLTPRTHDEPAALIAAWLGLGRAERDQGEHRAAVAIAEETLDFLDRLETENGDARLRALGLLVDGLTGSAQYPRAETALRELQALSETLDSEAAKLRAHERAVVLYEAWGKADPSNPR